MFQAFLACIPCHLRIGMLSVLIYEFSLILGQGLCLQTYPSRFLTFQGHFPLNCRHLTLGMHVSYFSILGFQIVSERSNFQQLLQRYQERSAFQGILESSGIFSEVNVRKIVVPTSKWEDRHTDIGVQRIAESLRRTMSRLLSAMQEDIEMCHWNSDAFDAAQEEMTDQTIRATLVPPLRPASSLSFHSLQVAPV
ncbi:hypothetical protein JB92DRAFT_2837153 [Gautieria morchelliformis]|nr:hypothetical protein JB92DRAFT_2837153 [Gautieria morchelliformis]